MDFPINLLAGKHRKYTLLMPCFLCVSFCIAEAEDKKTVIPEVTPPIKVQKNSEDDSIKILTDILNKTSNLQTVDITCFQLVSENVFNTFRLYSCRVRASRNGQIVIFIEGIEDEKILDLYKKKNKDAIQFGKYRFEAKNDHSQLIWDGHVLKIFLSENGVISTIHFEVSEEDYYQWKYSKKNNSIMSNFGYAFLDCVIVLRDLFLTDSYQELEKKYKLILKDSRDLIYLSLESRKSKVAMNAQEIMIRFDKNKKELTELRLVLSEIEEKKVYSVESIKRSNKVFTNVINQANKEFESNKLKVAKHITIANSNKSSSQDLITVVAVVAVICLLSL